MMVKPTASEKISENHHDPTDIVFDDLGQIFQKRRRV